MRKWKQTIKIPMNQKEYDLKIISRNIQYSDISGLQPGHANPMSSESDLVSGKMKEAVIDTTITIIYNIRFNTSDTI